MRLPGRTVIVSLSDGSSLRGTTCWAWRALRLRDVYASPGSQAPDVIGLVIIPSTAIITLQVIPKEA